MQENDRESLKWGLVIAVVLGVLFTITQAYEYSHAAFGFSGNIYGANFYMATGFHGFHVIVGTIFLAVCLFRALKGHFTPKSHIGFEAAAWYWHFVDVRLAVPLPGRLHLGRLTSLMSDTSKLHEGGAKRPPLLVQAMGHDRYRRSRRRHIDRPFRLAGAAA